MRKYFIQFLIIALITASCSKDVTVEKVFTNLKLSEKEIFADGQSLVAVSAELSDKSSADRRTVIFSTSSGVFSSGTSKYTAKAEYVNGVLTVKAFLTAPVVPGTVKISVQPEFDSPLNEYMLTDSLLAKPSVPFTIKLSTSSYALSSNYMNEVFITGKLRSATQKFVSKGYKVLFEDLITLVPANGQFRETQAITGDSSVVSTFYTAPAYPIGTKIKIKGTLLDENGQKTPIADSLTLTINQ